MISCDQHDSIAIACTFQYPIKLTMKDGRVHQGVALDTKLNENKLECIKVDQNGSEVLIILDSISRMDVCIQNPHFQSVSFE